MKAIVHERYGRPDVLELREVAVPVAADDQVLVRVRASSVNPVEWYGVTGPVFARPGNGWRRPSFTGVGADVSGTVEAVGQEVEGLAPGRRGLRRRGRVVGRIRLRAAGAPRAEAREPAVRGSRRRPDRRYRGLGPIPHIVGTRLKARRKSQTAVSFLGKVTPDDLATLRRLLEAGTIAPVIDRRYPLEHAAEALAHLGEGHAKGKVVITI